MLLTGAALRAAVNRANGACLQGHDLARANDALRWQAVAEDLGVADATSDLDLATVLLNLCVRVDAQATLPAAPDALAIGLPAPLVVQAGYRFGTEALRFDRPLAVTIQAIGFAAPVAGGHTDGQGAFSTSVEASGSPPRSVDVQACFDETGLSNFSKVCGKRHLSGSSTTTTTPTTTLTSTTNSTLAGAGAVLTSRLSTASASAEAAAASPPLQALDNKEATDFANSDLSVHKEFSPTGEIGGVPLSAMAVADGRETTTFLSAGGGLSTIRPVGRADSRTFTSHDLGSITAGARTEILLQLSFTVTGAPIAYRIAANVQQLVEDATVACFKNVRFTRDFTTIAELTDFSLPDPQSTGRADVDVSGMLAPGVYALSGIVRCSPVCCQPGTRQHLEASYDINLRLGAAAAP